MAHHPIVFRGLKRINGTNYVERTVMQAIRNEVAVYAIHTNLDNVYHQGVNERIAEKIGLAGTRILAPKPGVSDIGAGLLGELPSAMNETDFLQLVKTAFRAGCVRHTALRGTPVKRVRMRRQREFSAARSLACRGRCVRQRRL